MIGERKVPLAYAALHAVAVTTVVLFMCTGVALAGSEGGSTRALPNPFSNGQGMLGVAVLDQNNIWSVGASGRIVFWNGTTLTEQRSGTANNLYGVAAADKRDVWAVGSSGIILHYNGKGWSRQASGTTYDLTAVSAVDSKHVWAVGSKDGWHEATILFYDGASWSAQKTYASGGLQDICALDRTHVWAVDLKTYFYDGSTWSIINDGSTYKPYRVSACSATEVWAVDWDGTVLRSTDGGVTWGTHYDLGGWPISISAYDSTNVYAVGTGGLIQKYDGTSWEVQESGTTVDLSDVDSRGAESAYSAVGDGLVLTSSGTTWASRTTYELAQKQMAARAISVDMPTTAVEFGGGRLTPGKTYHQVVFVKVRSTNDWTMTLDKAGGLVGRKTGETIPPPEAMINVVFKGAASAARLAGGVGGPRSTLVCTGVRHEGERTVVTVGYTLNVSRGTEPDNYTGSQTFSVSPI